jgi:predicted nucleotidyltransferase
MEPSELKQKLEKLGWSYAEAARQLGVSRGTITRWIRGERRIPETAIRLIDILGQGRPLETQGPAVLDQSKLTPFEKDLLHKLVSRFSNLPEVRKILLFGSRARGLSDEHSDLDVAVVTDTIDTAFSAALEEAKWEAISEDAFLYANVVAISAEKLKADTAFSRTLNKEGIEIWSRSEKGRSKRN